MTERRTITLTRGWSIILKDLGLDAHDLVRRAGLAPDLLEHEIVHLSVEEYFRLVDTVEREAADPTLGIRIGQTASPETFSPPIFAALCSSTLAVAVTRIAAHKRLIAPMRVLQQATDDGLYVGWEWDDPTIRSPRLLMAMELVFMTQLARIGTRERVQPLQVCCPIDLEPKASFEAYFGVAPTVGERLSLRFSAADAHRPFLTASESMWQTFEPDLQRRSSQLSAEAQLSERVRSVLLECLPGGEGAIEGAARRLGMSARTLQRRLGSEGFTFREIVQDTRVRLSRHYLVHTRLPYAEISFLLGFDEPSSFFRAFREWTDTTPESVRLDGVKERARQVPGAERVVAPKAARN